MFVRLTGLIADITENYVVVDVNGVGYGVAASARTRAGLTVGQTARLSIDTIVREDAINLYGFLDEAEQFWFRLLTSVQGVGPRVALAVLSAVPLHDLPVAIAVGDQAVITRADGVGPKLATRIITELKDKVPDQMVLSTPKRGPMVTAPGGGPITAAGGGVHGDAVSALVNLGYGRAEAFAVVMRLRDETAGQDVGTIVTRALQELMKGAA